MKGPKAPEKGLGSHGNPMPRDTQRHFPEPFRAPTGVDGSSMSPETSSAGNPFVIARLLEDGDRVDLQWLCREVGEARLGEWVQARGSRQLSKRSRLFWQLVLEVQSAKPRKLQEALWPL
ncbi:MAG: hypothetical protein K0U98_21915 [Deltaproteobacteria bacterium]|nr:hypothetical protein [Deltaproteobacteria bacterium]